MEMANYILSILKQNPIILMSWGARNFTVIENGLRFRVDGFLHKGYVHVVYDEGADLFNVSLVALNGKVKETINGLCFDQLTDVIDYHIENNDNSQYHKNIEEWVKTI